MRISTRDGELIRSLQDGLDQRMWVQTTHVELMINPSRTVPTVRGLMKWNPAETADAKAVRAALYAGYEELLAYLEGEIWVEHAVYPEFELSGKARLGRDGMFLTETQGAVRLELLLMPEPPARRP